MSFKQRIIYFILFFVAATLIFSCKKNSEGNESILYGTWIKGNIAVDTLRFFKRDGKNFIEYAVSFNPAFPARTESEYTCLDGKLSIKNYLATQNNFFPIQSFTWTQKGKDFEIQGSELYAFIAATFVRFDYHKI